MKQTVDSAQNAEDIEKKDDEYIGEYDDDDAELARNLSSADSDDSDEEEHTKFERGRVKGKLVWDESTLPY